MLNQLQEIALQSIYDGLLGIRDGLSLQDSSIAEIGHLDDAVVEMITALCEAFPSIERREGDVEDSVWDDEIGDGMSDVEADADTLRSAGWGTDEDYGSASEML